MKNCWVCIKQQSLAHSYYWYSMQTCSKVFHLFYTRYFTSGNQCRHAQSFIYTENSHQLIWILFMNMKKVLFSEIYKIENNKTKSLSRKNTWGEQGYTKLNRRIRLNYCKIQKWGTTVSSNNKTDLHDITEILLKVALNTITLISSNISKKNTTSVLKL